MADQMALFRARLAETLGPLREQRAELQTAIAAKLAEVDELRAAERELTRVLRAADPSERPGPKRKSQDGSGSRVSEERQSEILQALREQFDGATFTAEDVVGFSALHKTTIHKLLAEMQRRGVLRLDHKGGARNMTKYYAVVSDG